MLAEWFAILFTAALRERGRVNLPGVWLQCTSNRMSSESCERRDYLREQAARCHRMVYAVEDQRIRKTLVDLADKYKSQADALDAELRAAT